MNRCGKCLLQAEEGTATETKATLSTSVIGVIREREACSDSVEVCKGSHLK